MDTFSEYASTALRILATVAGIGFLIFIHELGHFLMAVRNGVRVDIFSLGFGPVICSWRRGFGFRKGSSAQAYDEMRRRHEEMLKAEREGTSREDVHAFGEKVRALGATEYCVSWIPLGGFVKMAGEPLGEARTGATDELTSKSPWQRFEIFVAGTTMNFLFAFPLCIGAFLIGKNVTLPVVGSLAGIDSAEWEAGLLPGDRLKTLDGMPVPDLETYRREVLRAPHGKAMQLTVEREGNPDPVTLTLVPGGSERLGVLPRANVVEGFEGDSPAREAGLLPGDVILTLDGQPVWNEDDILRIIRTRAEKRLPVEVRRPSAGGPLTFQVTPVVREEPFAAFDPFERPSEPVIQHLHPKSPALDILARWDRILKVGGKPVKTVHEVQALVSALPGTPLEIEVDRGGETKSVKVTPRRAPNGRGVLDIQLGSEGVCLLGAIPDGSPLAGKAANWDRVVSVDGVPAPAAGWVRDRIQKSPGKTLELVLAQGTELKTVSLAVERGEDGKGWAREEFVQAYPALHEVPKTWPLAASGLQPGDRVLRLDTDGDGVLEVCKSLAELNMAAAQRRRPFPVVIERDGKELPPIIVTPGKIRHGALGVKLGVLTEFRHYGFGEAVALGAEEPIGIVVMTYQLLARILSGGESLKGVGGPIRIFSISYTVTGHGAGNFLWLLAMISVNLAVFNLFPIPVLDGGHILFLVVEKFKGSPVSETMLIRAQYVGLAFLFSLLILVTTNDIISGIFH